MAKQQSNIPIPMLKTILIALLLFAALCGPAKADSRQDELVYLRTILPDTLLQYAHLEVGSSNAVAVLGKGANTYLGLHIISGQNKVNNGIRAEVSLDYPYQQGQTVRYSWQFMLPSDFASDAPTNRWWLIGQWHDQPDKAKGETWNGFPSRSPPVAIGLAELDGHLVIGLSYGPTKPRNLGSLTVERGKWHSITVVIRWSRSSDGKASVYLDDLTKPALTADGPNMHNDVQHYLKLGMYRHPAINTDNWIYIDDVRISTVAKP
jgi:hypothetical protein